MLRESPRFAAAFRRAICLESDDMVATDDCSFRAPPAMAFVLGRRGHVRALGEWRSETAKLALRLCGELQARR